MQKDPPDPINSDFEKAAELPEDEQLNARVSVLSANLQAQYKMVLEQQERDMNFLKDEMDACRSENIADRTQRLRDRFETEKDLDLKPKYLPSVSNEELAKQAHEQAIVEVEAEEIARIEEMDRNHFNERVDLVFTLEVYHEHTLKFRESFAISINNDREDDHER